MIFYITEIRRNYMYKVSIILAAISVALLLVYGADVALKMVSKNSLLDTSIRTIWLGIPSLILPFFAIYLSKNNKSKLVPTLVLVTGVLIIIGGIFMGVKYQQESINEKSDSTPKDIKQAEQESYNPALFEIGTLLAIGGFQGVLGYKRISSSVSRHEV